MHMSVQRMLSFYMYRCVCHAPTSPKVKKGKDEHPHKIDEVPVQAGDFDDLVMPLPAREKAPPFDVEVPPPNLSRDGDQENHADRHVGAVEASDHENARTKLCRSPGRESLGDQLGPFERLHSDERCAKCRSDQHQDCGFGTIAAVTEIDGHRH